MKKTVIVFITLLLVAVLAVLMAINAFAAFTFTFDPCGGTADKTKSYYASGKAFSRLPIAAREGYAFCGWNTQSDGSGDFITESSICTAALNLYAVWSVPGDATADGKCNLKDLLRIKRVSAGYNPVTPYCDISGNGKFEEARDSACLQKLLLLGYDRIPVHTVNFMKNDNAGILFSVKVLHGFDCRTPIPESRSGYPFEKWSGSTENITNNINLYAQYTGYVETSSHGTGSDIHPGDFPSGFTN